MAELRDETEVLAFFRVDDALGLEDVLEFDGDVVLHPEGVELQLGEEGTLLPYPVTPQQLHQLSAELDPG